MKRVPSPLQPSVALSPAQSPLKLPGCASNGLEGPVTAWRGRLLHLL